MLFNEKEPKTGQKSALCSQWNISPTDSYVYGARNNVPPLR